MVAAILNPDEQNDFASHVRGANRATIVGSFERVDEAGHVIPPREARIRPMGPIRTGSARLARSPRVWAENWPGRASPWHRFLEVPSESSSKLRVSRLE